MTAELLHLSSLRAGAKLPLMLIFPAWVLAMLAQLCLHNFGEFFWSLILLMFDLKHSGVSCFILNAIRRLREPILEVQRHLLVLFQLVISTLNERVIIISDQLFFKLAQVTLSVTFIFRTRVSLIDRLDLLWNLRCYRLVSIDWRSKRICLFTLHLPSFLKTILAVFSFDTWALLPFSPLLILNLLHVSFNWVYKLSYQANFFMS